MLINSVLRCSSILKFLLHTPEPEQRKAITMVSNLFVTIFFSPSEIKSCIACKFFPHKAIFSLRHRIRRMVAVICLCSEAERRRAMVFKTVLTPFLNNYLHHSCRDPQCPGFTILLLKTLQTLRDLGIHYTKHAGC